ncbi:MAG TPA: prephenate dehydratase domain-containing protein [Ktedonobacterales bacterium]|nr:prephenate dehydratase domain-containing protein [Ktedonobacterales bacterium]
MQRIAFQGVPGAYSHEAVLWYFGEEITAVPCATFAAVFDAVARRAADAAMVPVGNSYAGPVQEVCNLMKDTNLVVAGTCQRLIRHCLLALPGQTLEHITRVISHPQALMQCDAYLERLNVETIEALDTAGSAKFIREQELYGVAAIASARAASMYQLAILAEDIQVRTDNSTSFVVLCSPILVREEFALLYQLKAARVQGQHDQAETLLRALRVRGHSADWGMRSASLRTPSAN